MTDFFDRQAVIDLFETYQPRMATSVIEFGNALKGLPTVKAEPVRHGHWIITGGTNVFGGTEIVCSECHDRVMVQRVEDELYCRHCGAKMDEEKEE